MPSPPEPPSEPPSEPTERWQLRPISQPELPRTISIPEDGLTLGRDPENVVVLPAEIHPFVSGFHCKLTIVGDDLVENHVVVEDLGSRNGTLVDGEPVEREVLRAGSTLALGLKGPRFVVIDAERNYETAMVTPQRPAKRRFGTETVALVREELGIPPSKGVEEMVVQQRRRTYRVVGVTVAFLVLAFAAILWTFSRSSGEAMAELRESLRGDLESQRAAWLAESEALQNTWEARRQQLERERDSLEASVQELHASEETATEALRTLQEKLESTNRILQSYDPVNLEQGRLEEVQRVENAVVLVEVSKTYRQEDSGNLLRMSRAGGSVPVPNTEGRGEVLVRESSGSGFCISPDGWILTNAHVALKKGDAEDALDMGGLTFVPEVELRVVFSGTDQRHAAVLVDWRSEDNDDLALLKIEPFEGMPSLPELEIDAGAEVPPQGSEIFVIGFPLGTRALQEEETVIASTFRGIVSRYVDEFLQVDAAVHPGASGGPVIDGEGNVLGVVVGMQATDDYGGASSAIGYIIPIAEAASMWPRER